MSRHLVREGARSYECGGPGTVACCAECAGYDPVAALRAELATLQERYECNTAIMHARTESLAAATRELAETKAALEESKKWHAAAGLALESSRSETAAATARIAELEETIRLLPTSKQVNDAMKAETALRELRERVEMVEKWLRSRGDPSGISGDYGVVGATLAADRLGRALRG